MTVSRPALIFLAFTTRDARSLPKINLRHLHLQTSTFMEFPSEDPTLSIFLHWSYLIPSD